MPAAESPCRGCRLERRTKRNRICRECDRRCEFVAALGGMTHSVPVEMSDLTAPKVFVAKANTTYHPLHAPQLDE